jgi:hypothetical protein
MSSDVDALRALITDIERGIAETEARLQRQIDALKSAGAGLAPNDMVDSMGRSILLDARISLLAARIALVNATRV